MKIYSRTWLGITGCAHVSVSLLYGINPCMHGDLGVGGMQIWGQGDGKWENVIGVSTCAGKARRWRCCR
jgi:hypothetical protein